MSDHLDLGALARTRGPRTGELRPPRRWLRFAVPLALLAVFLVVLATSLEGVWRGARAVTWVRPEPVVGAAFGGAAAGSVAAQAAGWIEPDPFPVRVTALAEGVVAELLVQESDAVAAGDVIARLVDADARLALARAEAELARAQAEERRMLADLDAARRAFEAPTALLEAVEVGRAERRGKQAEAEHRAQAVLRGRADVRIAEEEVLVQRELEAAGVAGPRQVEIAEARVEAAQAELAILQADAALAAAEAEVADAKARRAELDFELRIEDTLRVEASTARCAEARAQVDAARAALDEARLRLERMELRAPSAGVVLERLATLGTPLGAERDAVVTLYDPASLRVRVDVPQQDLAKLFVGQEARVESDARRGRPYRGEVLRIVRQADIQKVTLQAHVRVLDGDELLRPEMLVQVRFLAPAAAEGERPDAAEGTRVAIPARLLLPGDQVWVVDGLSGRAALRGVSVAQRDGERALLSAGIDLSHKLIDSGREGLRVGDRLAVEER